MGGPSKELKEKQKNLSGNLTGTLETHINIVVKVNKIW